ncbi:MAG: tail fiber domain-containing protein [Sulfitobacter sp.]
MVDQVNPWGSVNYDQIGNTRFQDSFGNWVEVPRYQQTTNFSPEQQAIFDSSQGAQTNMANIAQEQSGRVKDALSDPFEFTNQDAADWSYDLATSRILPQQERNEAALRSKMINSGLRPGSAAWDSEMQRMTNANTDQMNQLALNSRGQAFGENLATRNQPMNELNALLSGSQVSNPAAMSGATPEVGVGGVDYAGMVQDQYQSQVANSGGLMGGLFGLAGSLGGAAVSKWSDIRLKENISRVGTLDNGLPVFLYRYKSGGPMHIGVMAQDVEKVNPEAVQEIGGFKAVNYAEAVL